MASPASEADQQSGAAAFAPVPETTSRWLLRKLPWTPALGGTYRVQRRTTHQPAAGRLAVTNTGSVVALLPVSLRQIPMLGFVEHDETLRAVAARFEQREYRPGEIIAASGTKADHLYVIASGQVTTTGTDAVLSTGEHFGATTLTECCQTWGYTATARTAVTILALPRPVFYAMVQRSQSLFSAMERFRARSRKTQQETVPFVGFENTPRDYELSVAQSLMRVPRAEAGERFPQQLQVVVETLRERQEDELINDRRFGLLHNADLRHRVYTRSGPPTPDDLDDLLALREETDFLLAHPKAIAAFGRECTKRGVRPAPIVLDGHPAASWRGVPILPCGKIPISDTHTTSILALRTGEERQGVIGLHQTGVEGEHQYGLSVRPMASTPDSVSYLVSAYYSAALLAPDALGVLGHVELSH
ncbi:family 2B encapsulin nanocompartment shell protein [Symbioplanes lichenis]|uniref:family 2B encapsulin nanocompartment shell protein n=1 Tax=Symbioplanes lichenis TaxID=1629072 RepID=UPI002738A52E|nr:family 2B encapsulin nanocompartment shell protein [Actinoplanes lichenis]